MVTVMRGVKAEHQPGTEAGPRCRLECRLRPDSHGALGPQEGNDSRAGHHRPQVVAAEGSGLRPLRTEATGNEPMEMLSTPKGLTEILENRLQWLAIYRSVGGALTPL